jgi:hypothetical protein
MRGSFEHVSEWGHVLSGLLAQGYASLNRNTVVGSSDHVGVLDVTIRHGALAWDT